jgi:hypothetical protein
MTIDNQSSSEDQATSKSGAREFLIALLDKAGQEALTLLGDTGEIAASNIDDLMAFVDGQQRTVEVDMITTAGALLGFGGRVKGDHPPSTFFLEHAESGKVAIYLFPVRETSPGRADNLAKMLSHGEPDARASHAVPVPGTGGWTIVGGTGVRASVHALERAFAAPSLDLMPMHDAVVHGVLDDALLNREIEIAFHLHGPDPSLRQGPWTTVPQKVVGLLNHLTTHVEDKKKEGKCILQGALIGGERKSKAATCNHILMLDADAGDGIQTVIETIKRLGLFAIVYSTHSHMKPISSIGKDELLKFVGKDAQTYTLEDAGRYLTQKKRYRPMILKDATILKEEFAKDGMTVFVKHADMPKFRVVFVLKEPFDFGKRHARQADAISEWKDRHRGVAKLLDVAADRATVDPARVMYTPRHTPGAPFEMHVIAGRALDIDVDCERVKEGGSGASNDDPFADAASETGASKSTYKTKGLLQFFAKYGDRFEADDFFLEMDPDGDRGSRASGPGRTHRCPNDDAHTDAGNPEDKGFFCVNASEDTREQATARCSHDSCQGLDRINFIDIICEREGIANAEELVKRWVPRTVEDDEEEAAEAAKAVEQVTYDLKPFTSSKDAEAAIFAIEKNDYDAGMNVARCIGLSAFAPAQIDGLKKRLAKQSGVGARSLDAEIRKGQGERPKTKKETKGDDELETILQKWNDNFTFVGIKGSGVVAYHATDGYEFTNWRAFEGTYAHDTFPMVVGDKEKLVPVSKIWMEWEKANKCIGITFKPGLESERIISGKGMTKLFNTFSGMAVQPKKGDVAPWLTVIREVLASGDEALADRIVAWMAYNVQQFGDVSKKIPLWMVFKGKQGAGKSSVFEVLAKCFGRHGVILDKPQQVIGQFNSMLTESVFVILEEALFAKDHRVVGPLKNLISGRLTTIERKGIDAVQVPNYTFGVIISNEMDPVPMDDDNRRLEVHEVSDCRVVPVVNDGTEATQTKIKDNGAFWKSFHEWEAADGPAHVLDYLLGYKPKDGWDFLRIPPSTKAGDGIVARNLPILEKCVLTWAWDGALPEEGYGAAAPPTTLSDRDTFITTEILTDAIRVWVKKNGTPRETRDLEISNQSVGLVLRKMLPSVAAEHGQRGNGRLFPPQATLLDVLAKRAPSYKTFLGGLEGGVG